MGFSPLVNTLQFLQGVNARETCASFWTGRDAPGFAFSDITPCSAARGVLNYRRFRELMPSVGLYSESRPDGTHAWSAWDPLGPGSEILR